MLVSLITPPTTVTDEEALEMLAQERSKIDVGTVVTVGADN